MGDLGQYSIPFSPYESEISDELSEDLADLSNTGSLEAVEGLFDSDDSDIHREESQSLLDFLLERYELENVHYDPHSGEPIDRDRLRNDISYVRELTERLGTAYMRAREGGMTPSVSGIVNNILREVPPLGQGGFTTILKVAATLCFAATNFPHVIVAESLSFIFTNFAGPKMQFALSLALLALRENEGKSNAIAAATLKVKNVLRAPLGAGKPGSSSSIRGGTIGMYQSVGDQVFKVLQFLTTLSEKGPGFAVDFDCFNCQENGDVGILYGYPRWQS